MKKMHFFSLYSENTFPVKGLFLVGYLHICVKIATFELDFSYLLAVMKMSGLSIFIVTLSVIL